MSKPVNSIEVIKPFARIIQDYNNLPEIQLIGGVYSAALKDPDTIIDIKNKEIIAPSSLTLSNRRENGSLRDLDILVKSSDSSDIEEIDAYVKDIVDGDLDSSVFGYKTNETLQKQQNHPILGYAALKTCLSDRYEGPDSKPDQMVKSLFPLSVPIDPESLETWTLVVGKMRIPVPHPSMAIINYTNRSISGLRSKDVDKVVMLADKVFKHDELLDWAIDGPGKTQVELGLLLRSFTPNKDHKDIFNINKKILTLHELAEHEAFIPIETNYEQKLRILSVASLKATILSNGESNPVVTTLFQNIVERRLSSIVNNE